MMLPPQVHSYISHKGWMNGQIMVEWMKEIVIPYLNGTPGALVMDDYAAHWVDEVLDLARLHQIELIRVPPTTTWECQPLDISVMGPMKQIRQRLSNETRWE